LIEIEARKMSQSLGNGLNKESHEVWKSKLIEVMILKMLLIWVGLRLRLDLIEMEFIEMSQKSRNRLTKENEDGSESKLIDMRVLKMFLISTGLRWRLSLNLIEMEFIEMSQKGVLLFNCSSNSFPYTFRLRQSKLRISSRMGIL
jgi:hypothetical protein